MSIMLFSDVMNTFKIYWKTDFSSNKSKTFQSTFCQIVRNIVMPCIIAIYVRPIASIASIACTWSTIKCFKNWLPLHAFPISLFAQFAVWTGFHAFCLSYQTQIFFRIGKYFPSTLFLLVKFMYLDLPWTIPRLISSFLLLKINIFVDL